MKVLREPKKRGSSDEKAPGTLHTVKWQMTSAVSTSHILPMVNCTLVPRYSFSLTTSGKCQRGACVEHFRQDAMERLEVSA